MQWFDKIFDLPYFNIILSSFFMNEILNFLVYETALHMAVTMGNLDIVNILLSNDNVDVNVYQI